MQGVVTKSTGSWYRVRTVDGEFHDCRIKGKFRIQGIKSTNPVVVGDIVKIQDEEGSWMIIELYQRKNYIVRKSVNLSKQTHIIAANVDQAILMVTLQSPATRRGFIDRFLVSAQAYGVEVIIFSISKIFIVSKPYKIKTNYALSMKKSAIDAFPYLC